MDLKIKKEWMLALVVLFSICMFVVSLPGGAQELDAQVNVSQGKIADISGHWANEVIKEWIEKDIITGYPDGTFKPNSSITRAEFMTLVNKAFGYKDEAQIEFSDVNDKAWFMGTVKKAAAAGYIGGYPDGTVRPNNPISRQEVAVVIAKIAGLSAEAESADLFTDALSIPGWSKGQVGAAAAAGYMGGYPDGSFRPANNITRAEAVMALNKTLAAMDIDEKVQRVFDKPGTYGPEVGKEVLEGDVWITVSGVKLQNMTIKGNLYITEGVGEGEVALNNIIVEGDTYIRGGGADSIYINGGEYNRIIIQKTKNGVRVIAIGTKGAAVIIEEETEDNEVILGGDFESVTVLAEGVTITTQGKTNIKKLTIQENAKNASVTTSKDTTINEAVVNTNAEFDNQGRIIEATGKAARESIYDVNMPENLLSRRSSSSSGGGPTPPPPPPPPPQSEFAGGSGTEADPWLISTPEHLNNIRNYLSQEHADKYFKQTADISLENWGEWVPIGVDEGTQMFAGNYNGQGYIISNLFIDLPETNYVGLFGSIGEAKLENIILEGVDVTGRMLVGALVGYMNNSDIINCSSSGSITGEFHTIGGLAGYSYHGTITNCFSEGTVTAGYGTVGGLVGRVYDGSIQSSYSTASVENEEHYDAGGLVGSLESDGVITESNSSGSVTGIFQVGGLAGRNIGGLIITCYSTGNVTGTSDVGGLVGRNYSTVQDSYARGDVQCPNRAGGLVGDNRSNIINSYSTGYVSGTDDVGGLVGLDDGGTVTNSFYDQITSGQNDIGNGTPKTTTDMKDQATFDAAGIDWDFESIWGINSGENDGYPFLRWQGYEHQLQSAQLLGHWLFDEGTGTVAYDSSGNGNHGTLEAAVWTADQFGNDGMALELGVDKWVNIPDTIKPSEITVCAWVYITATDGSAGPVFSAEKGLGGTGFGYRLQVTSDGKLRMEAIAPYTVTGARTVTSAVPLNFNQWYHVAGTYDGNNVKIFIDGVLEGSSSFDTYEGLNSDISIPLAIGHLEGWSVQWFRGKIDDARIYDSALTQEQILNIVTR